MPVSVLLSAYLDELRQAAEAGPVLDLACGNGRNGLYLLQRNIPVVFADIATASLEQVSADLAQPPCQAYRHLAKLWQTDFERAGTDPLEQKSFGAILVFRYLHRPLMPGIRRAVCPGGLVIYETFTLDQARFGRPNNPDFLLKPGELRDAFAGWEALHYFEGVVKSENAAGPRAIAQIVAQKPALTG